MTEGLRRSGRVRRAPLRYEPQEVVMDDYPPDSCSSTGSSAGGGVDDSSSDDTYTPADDDTSSCSSIGTTASSTVSRKYRGRNNTGVKDHERSHGHTCGAASSDGAPTARVQYEEGHAAG